MRLGAEIQFKTFSKNILFSISNNLAYKFLQNKHLTQKQQQQQQRCRNKKQSHVDQQKSCIRILKYLNNVSVK